MGDSPVTMNIARQKTRLRILPVVFVVVALVFLGGAALSLFFWRFGGPSSQLATYPMITSSLSQTKHAKGQILVKFKTNADQTAIVSQVLTEPQIDYVDKQTKKKVGKITIDVIRDAEKYERVVKPLVLGGTRSVFPVQTLSPAVTKKLEDQRKSIQGINSVVGLNQWQVIEVNVDADIADLALRFRGQDDVEAAEPNYQYSLIQEGIPEPMIIPDDSGGSSSSEPPLPSDPYFRSTGSWGNTYPDQWGSHRIDIRNAWALTKGSASVIVAVSDTGIDAAHVDIGSRIWTNIAEIPGNSKDDDNNGFVDDVKGWDFVGNDNNPMDGHGHGTHVAGVVGAATNNAIGVAGLNWDIRLMAVKGLSDGGIGYDDDLAATIYYAANNGADVINMSWGGYGSSQLVSEALDYAYSLGVVSVAAAGNSNSITSEFFPANHPHVITVAAWCPSNAAITYCSSAPAGSRASFSNYGEEVEVTAPGVDILSLRSSAYSSGTGVVGGSYLRMSGTSMAAPHVAGVAALLRAFNPAVNPDLASFVLQISAEDVLSTGRDIYSGAGLLDAAAAIATLQSIVINPRPDLTVTASSARVSGTGQGQIESTVANIGFAAANNVRYTFFSGHPDDGRVIGSGTLPSLAIDQKEIVSFSYSLDQFPDGTVTTRVFLDNPSLEFSTANNERQTDLSLLLPGWPKDLRTQYLESSPTIADVDGDGQTDIAIASGTNFGGSNCCSLHVIKSDGTEMSGWPKNLNGHVDGSPIVTDLDGDGQNDVITNVNGYGVYAWDASGAALPGWPWLFPTIKNLYGSPAAADIDRDGQLEIVFKEYDTKIRILRSNGTEVTTGWPKAVGGSSATTPVAGDLDGDGSPEIIVTTGTGGMVYAWHADGTQVFAANVGGVFSTPAVADVNGDGTMEVIVGDRSNRVHALDLNGENIVGWPVTVGSAVEAPPVAADLDGDGTVEVIAGSVALDNKVYVWRADGTLLSGWPQSVGARIEASPAVADVDGDGRAEIFVATMDPEGFVYAWHLDGSPLNHWPQKVGGAPPYLTPSISSSPAVGDINDDRRTDIVVGGMMDGKLYVWGPIEAVPGHPRQWPTFHHDFQRTGRFDRTGLDTMDPTVSITQPANYPYVSGPVTVNIPTTDNFGVTRVEINIDGQLTETLTHLPPDPQWTYTYMVAGDQLSEESHTLEAKVFDQALYSAMATFQFIVDRTPPGVLVTAPREKQKISGTFKLGATASDLNGLKQVEFLLLSVTVGTRVYDEYVLGTDLTAPYSLTLNTKQWPNGQYQLVARATDRAGNMKTSAVRTMEIKN